MKSTLTCLVLIVSFATTLSGQDVQDNWHRFRGPTNNGISSTATPPFEWNAIKNVAWKVKIPGQGTGSPIVWDNKVFVVTAVPVAGSSDSEPVQQMSRNEIFQKFDENEDGELDEIERNAAIDFSRQQKLNSVKPHQFTVMCFDRKDGRLIWKKIAIEKKPHDTHHDDHGYASASPVTDGRHLYVSFGSAGIFCYDLNGQLIWKRTDVGQMKTRYGFGEGSSLALYKNKLILPWDHEGQSRIEVLDKATGKTVWKKDREEPSNWLTPRVVEVNSRPMIVHGGENFTRGYDLETGEEIWRSAGLSGRPVASPVIADNVAVYASALRGPRMAAFYLDRSGEVTEKLWTINQRTPDCPSLALSGNRLYFLSANNAILSCANVQTGQLFFGPERLQGLDGVYSSPVIADGKVFITGRNGVTTVLQDNNKFKVLHTNDIGEPVDATLALAGNQMFIRGRHHLFCIEE